MQNLLGAFKKKSLFILIKAYPNKGISLVFDKKGIPQPSHPSYQWFWFCSWHFYLWKNILLYSFILSAMVFYNFCQYAFFLNKHSWTCCYSLNVFFVSKTNKKPPISRRKMSMHILLDFRLFLMISCPTVIIGRKSYLCRV